MKNRTFANQNWAKTIRKNYRLASISWVFVSAHPPDNHDVKLLGIFYQNKIYTILPNKMPQKISWLWCQVYFVGTFIKNLYVIIFPNKSFPTNPSNWFSGHPQKSEKTQTPPTPPRCLDYLRKLTGTTNDMKMCHVQMIKWVIDGKCNWKLPSISKLYQIMIWCVGNM